MTVAVTGLGLVTPAGIGQAENWRRICAGESTAQLLSLPGLGPRIACQVPDFDPVARLGARNARRLDRFTQLAMVAAREAVQDAGLTLDAETRPRTAVVMGNGLGGMATLEAQHHKLLTDGPDFVSPLLMPMFLPNMAAAQLAIDLGATGPNLMVGTACAAGATAIGIARQLLLSGACDLVIAGGAESALTPLTLTAFDRLRALSRRTAEPALASRPFDAERDGFVIAEGAGVLVLERTTDARRRGARIRAELVGFGASGDAHHVTDPAPDGQGAETAVRTALAEAGATPADVAHVNAHGTATVLNDRVEAALLARVFPHAPAITATKGVTGHALGAAGAIEAACTVLAVQNSTIPPTANVEKVDPEFDLNLVTEAPRHHPIPLALSTSFGFGGQNAALLFAAT